MIRVVAQHGEKLYAILGLFDPENCVPVMVVDGRSYYRVETHDHFILYRGAISGWGEAAKPGKTFNENQR